eukprot:CAMPEP_0196805768 /NCGR_PEP_ID=MMETSP1362-20130617/5591_1 /TAXON_ID=163516 /ORGANISM="Leptocylindrus danicus, Strain CCMP1856" /LENGTH=290 /DNA_ID=CAMNT_0042178891 /DNA_START=91 /DNA_END=963 /DNA_ORIENTATION=-
MKSTPQQVKFLLDQQDQAVLEASSDKKKENVVRQVSPPPTPLLKPVALPRDAEQQLPATATTHQDSEDAEERLARNRERNREHARRTRLRKKEQLNNFQNRVKELEDENRVLKQSVEECKVASILLGLACPVLQQKDMPKLKLDDESSSDKSVEETKEDEIAVKIQKNKRKRFVSDVDELVSSKNAKKTHINWKSGILCDENGEQRQLSPDELDSLRRERNRVHAKMTRDRKKMFMATIEKTIAQLESENQKMRETLAAHIAATAVSSSNISSLIVAASEASVSAEQQMP